MKLLVLESYRLIAPKKSLAKLFVAPKPLAARKPKAGKT